MALEQFNVQWASIRNQVPYFHRLHKERRLPDRFADWSEFQAVVPTMDKRTLQDPSGDLRNKTRADDFTRTTGGSTAQPVQVASWNSELEFSTKDIWLGRSWFGVEPSDRLFLVWGHSHILGAGLRGRVNSLKRRVKDRLLGYYRHSAYDLSEPGLRGAAERLLEFQPAFLIGYSVALDRLVRINRDLQSRFEALQLKVAIGTGESFPRTDSAQLISEVLGVPVAMEYGSMETGPIAHQQADGRYAVFWRHFFVEGQPSKVVDGAHEIVITTLYPRCVPLVRYRLGDLISCDPNESAFDQQFDSVIGRCNDVVRLGDGSAIHSEAFAHSLKEFSEVVAYQLTQSEGQIRLNYVSPDGLSTSTASEIMRRLIKVSPGLSDVRLNRVDQLQQTVSGKTGRTTRSPSSP